MNEDKTLREAAAAYGSQYAGLDKPIILENEGQPMAVILSFEEYRRLRELAADAAERQQSAWADLDALLRAVHARPTELSPEQLESEITTAREEVRQSRRAHGRSR